MTDFGTPFDFTTGDTITEARLDTYRAALLHLKEHDWAPQNTDGTAHITGEVVVLDATGSNRAKRCTSVGQAGRMGVAYTSVAASATGYYATYGQALVNVQGTVAIDDPLQTSDTAGRAQSGRANAFATALTSNASGAGQVLALLGSPGQALAAGVAVGGGQIIESGGVGEAVAFALEAFDTGALHFTSAANLTGTVAKTSASAALVGTGTAFTTELSVGQLFDVPGTAIERRVVIAIADDTHLTASAVYANSASGQTATRVNTGLVCRAAGLYLATGHVQYNAPGTTGDRYSAVLSTNGQPGTGAASPHAAEIGAQKAGTFPSLFVAGLRNLALWDWVELYTYQDSGSDKTLQSAHLDMVRLGG